MTIDISFFLTSLVIVLIPGTGVIFTVSTGIRQGKMASIWAAMGCTLGIVPHLLATVCGVATLLHASALAFQFVKYAGVAYLLYLAISTLRDEGSLKVDDTSRSKGRQDIVTKAILINLLNPKLTVFFMAFLPQFIRLEGPPHLVQLTTFSLLFMLMTFVVFVIYGVLADRFRSAIVDSPSAQKWMKRLVAGAFTSMGLKLAFSE